jgi:hypothetical protein
LLDWRVNADDPVLICKESGVPECAGQCFDFFDKNQWRLIPRWDARPMKMCRRDPGNLRLIDFVILNLNYAHSERPGRGPAQVMQFGFD